MRSKITYHLGIVRWFDDHTGRGIITSEDGSEYKVHYSSIDAKSKWKTLKRNSKVKFTIVDDPDQSIVERVVEV